MPFRNSEQRRMSGRCHHELSLQLCLLEVKKVKKKRQFIAADLCKLCFEVNITYKHMTAEDEDSL